ncbi:MAG TPA: hypothetical protein VGB37_16945 [Candidatus Lokiarchaeia archaeon]
MHRGYIKLWRCLLDDNLIHLSPETITVMLILLLKAQHEKYNILWNNEKLELSPGQLITTEGQLQASCRKLSRQNIRTFLKILEKMNFLTMKLTMTKQAGTLINITNWDKYQNASNHETNHELTIDQPLTNHELTTNNNVKNVKNIKECKEYKNLFVETSAEFQLSKKLLDLILDS